MKKPLVGIVMGSQSDWDVMQHAVDIVQQFGVPCEAKVVSAHRTPDLLYAYAEQAEARGLQCIIAGAGGAAHLPGMLAAKTIVPVLGVPVTSRALQGLDSLLSIVQMPKGILLPPSPSVKRAQPMQDCSPSRRWRATTPSSRKNSPPSARSRPRWCVR